jgi:hypothetical protein
MKVSSMKNIHRSLPGSHGRRWLPLLALLLIVSCVPRTARASGTPSPLPSDGLATLLLVSAGVVAIVWLARGRSRAPDLEWPDHHEPTSPPPAAVREPAEARPEHDRRERKWGPRRAPAEPAPADPQSPPLELEPEPEPEPPPLPTRLAPSAHHGREVTPGARHGREVGARSGPRPQPVARERQRQLAWALRPSRRGLMAVLRGEF